MITLTRDQFTTISNKRHILSQCEWFRNQYGSPLIIRDKYYLEFKTPKEETFFLLKYSDKLF